MAPGNRGLSHVYLTARLGSGSVLVMNEIRNALIAKLTEAYKTGEFDRFVDVDTLAEVLVKTSDDPMGVVEQGEFWRLALAYPAHSVPDWFDFAWIPTEED